MRLPSILSAHALLAGVLVGSLAMSTAAAAAPVKARELIHVRGARENLLYGYGLVVGLAGTGDTEQTLFATQAVSGLLGRLGVRIDPRDIRVRNVAAVIVTAELPTFVRPGGRLDVHISSLGNARSLQGGTLVMTPLQGPDSKTYAVAQGSVQVSAFQVASAGTILTRNQPNSGNIPMGAIVERDVSPELGQGGLVVSLRKPDFATAVRLAKAIEAVSAAGQPMEGLIAKVTTLDAAAVKVEVANTAAGRVPEILAAIEDVEVEAVQRARVVISDRTGTVVAGEGVRLRPVAVVFGDLEINVQSTPQVSQPGAFSQTGTTVRTDQANITTRENTTVAALPATTTLGELVNALKLLGATSRELVEILQAIHSAGALDAELEVR
ncbi:MAG: flagellar basal body P-ring protein FlgI [Deltaproteobacteria bacterium]|nr:flagellar basal body P-ring protein FlgI [Planctomycetota bacterium]MBM4279558.1 flagellar basal body P-ring protein FlgI [Deltaproteobacteria bacterium]